MTNRNYQISGTTGIDQGIEEATSYGHYQRINTQKNITSRSAHNLPIDTSSMKQLLVNQPHRS